MTDWHAFERALSVSGEDVEIELHGHEPVSWADFLLNPRRLRGSDFLMRWSQGQWSEHCLIQAVRATDLYFALPYGPSGTAPDDVREFELYFERLEAAGLGQLKRPDLLIFHKSDESTVSQILERLGGVQELPFVSERHPDMAFLLASAVFAIECENSLWKARQMPDYTAKLAPQKRLGGKPGLRKGAVLPTVILKEEDRLPLAQWQEERGVKIHIWHTFYDLAFGVAFDTAQELITSGKIEPTIQIFQAPGGATTKKAIYKIYHHYTYPLAETIEEPKLEAASIVDKNGHILPYVKFTGGRLKLSVEVLHILAAASQQ